MSERPTYFSAQDIRDFFAQMGWTSAHELLTKRFPARTLLELNTGVGKGDAAKALGTAIHAAIDDSLAKNPGDELIRRGDAIRACGSSRMRTMESLAKLPAYKRIIAPSDFNELEARVLAQLSKTNDVYGEGSVIGMLEISAGATITGVDMIGNTGLSFKSMDTAIPYHDNYSNINRIKENPVSENFDTKVVIETITFATLPGFTSRVDVKTLTPGQLASVTRVIEDKLKTLREIAPEYRSARVNKHIAELDQGLRDLVKAVNAADGVTAGDD